MSRSQERQVFDGDALRTARLAAGLTQEQLARKINVTLRTVIRWHDNEAQPGGSNLLALAAVLDVAPSALFCNPSDKVAA